LRELRNLENKPPRQRWDKAEHNLRCAIGRLGTFNSWSEQSIQEKEENVERTQSFITQMNAELVQKIERYHYLNDYYT